MPAALVAMALAAAVLSPAVGASASSLHPKGLSASLVDGTVTLSWTAPVDDAGSVTGYQVLRRRPGVDAVGTFHVVAEDTASAETSFVDRCADQANTKYTYRVKARRGDQLSRWGNYSRVDLAADYVSPDPQTGCDPDTGAPTDNDNGGDGVGAEGVTDSAVSVKSDANDQQNNKQIVPTPDEDEGEILVPRSSLQNTDSAQFQDRSELSGLPASHPNALGRVGHGIESSTFLATFTYKHFWPRDVTASLTSDGITLTWRNPNQGAACAEYERVPGTRTLKKVTHPSGYNTWEVTETGGGFRCIDRREIQGFEIYRTSFGHVHRGGGTVELLSDSQPYLIDTVIAGTTRFTDRSHDALVGPRRHNYQIRALYATGGNIVGGNIVIDRDFGSRLSASSWVHREHDAAQ
ncbi:fibronectin type III domain-containing protein [Candidatus Poriferisodalis sp.]|uniref:fibronectin type III domain-containing protein n=1 Tax=Candidatus Poriferisodalis sp. TaxID=3101277 RepID=UPI003B52773D